MVNICGREELSKFSPLLCITDQPYIVESGVEAVESKPVMYKGKLYNVDFRVTDNIRGPFIELMNEMAFTPDFKRIQGWTYPGEGAYQVTLARFNHIFGTAILHFDTEFEDGVELKERILNEDIYPYFRGNPIKTNILDRIRNGELKETRIISDVDAFRELLDLESELGIEVRFVDENRVIIVFKDIVLSNSKQLKKDYVMVYMPLVTGTWNLKILELSNYPDLLPIRTRGTSYWHPHVDMYGYPCFGEHENFITMRDSWRKAQFLKFALFMKGFLTSYSERHAFTKIESIN